MEKLILKELKELKSVISKLIGTSDLPAKERFSKEAILKASKEFQKLSIERGEWISDWDLYAFVGVLLSTLHIVKFLSTNKRFEKFTKYIVQLN
jgi:hypothetical protein